MEREAMGELLKRLDTVDVYVVTRLRDTLQVVAGVSAADGTHIVLLLDAIERVGLNPLMVALHELDHVATRIAWRMRDDSLRIGPTRKIGGLAVDSGRSGDSFFRRRLPGEPLGLSCFIDLDAPVDIII
jgi:hypothetical protein